MTMTMTIRGRFRKVTMDLDGRVERLWFTVRSGLSQRLPCGRAAVVAFDSARPTRYDTTRLTVTVTIRHG